MPFKSYGTSWLLSSLKNTSVGDLVTDDPRKELVDYVNSSQDVAQEGEQELDPIKWWGVCMEFSL